jgi:hypothetical protein
MNRILLSLFLFIFVTHHLQAQSGVYGGGPIYKNRNYSINELRNSGFTYVVVWTIHIDASGNFNFNAEFPLIQNGTYIGASSYPNFANDIALLKSAPSTINRVEFCLSAWGGATFTNVKNLIAAQGTGSTSTLYKNFQALKNTFPSVDAIAFDDEQTFDAGSATSFAVMLGNLGFKVSLVPYNNKTFWTTVATNTNNQRPGTVDRVDLQCYSGGASNTPCNWSFGSVPVYAGLWDANKTTAQVQSQLTTWKNSCGTIVKGGFMWLYDDFDNTSGTAAYATAIRNVFGGGTLSTPAVTFYKDCNYTGLGISLPLGDYTLTRLRSFGILNDDISSLKVNSGYKTLLYANDNFGGSSLTITADNSCLVTQSWNDATSSLRVQTASALALGSAKIAPLDLALYPNPATNEIRMHTNFELNGGIIQVYDITGRPAQAFKVVSDRLDISRLPAGIYTLVYTKDGKNITKRFVKN